MLRNAIPEALRAALKNQEKRAISTVRLIIAALKDRDIAARGKGNTDGIGDDEILQMLQTMVKQRHDSIEMYEKGGRLELAEQEREEIAIIEDFLPQQLGDAEIGAAVDQVIAEVGAGGMKDMGNVMGALRDRYTGQMDFGKASALVKEKLGAG
ncbi:MAG: GatB/YqeY domain-containing protein [Alphaproteobacteria bacterium]|jgi:hypothetical protein|nr:GatB/YqeY domain-containing protein [Alphaproteobacteria bacterium]MCZ6511455.1 GatB/YqeY domain-containing protein [Alphaproteobacteria bacterium]MCZ6588174.1 GatB/YqeY domain-containing protein [Alphaproteobacteria bacterium]MCZ6591953.1 GatB/YqeY domain-containing protein [Alphaproteobacteria bacterium]MCZ6840743.1 GatB/YqeY domain-containing protein [Alphaproteobacteria bacterium]